MEFFFVFLISRCSNDYCKQFSARPYLHANKESAELTFASCRAYANSTTFFVIRHAPQAGSLRIDGRVLPGICKFNDFF